MQTTTKRPTKVRRQTSGWHGAGTIRLDRRALLAVAVLLAGACGGPREATDGVGQGTGASALAIGARGADVVAAHDYFTRAGYFENDSLRAQYPFWVPVVGRGPADDSVFGPELKAAVSAFQTRAALPATGAIDAATRAMMATRFCGVPDSLVVDDGGEDKWNVTSTQFQTHRPVTYAVNLDPDCATHPGLNPCDNIGQLAVSNVTAAINISLSTWGAKTNVNFTPVAAGATPDFTIQFTQIGPPGSNILGAGNKTQVLIANNPNWGTTGFDILGVMLHEVGHMLGLQHSSIATPRHPVMWPGEAPNQPLAQSLQSDDLQAIAVSPYTSWKPATNTASEGVDVGTGVTSAGEFTWKVGNGRTSDGGYRIWRWREATGDWLAINAGGGVRIDMAGDTPWFVTAGGLIKSVSGISASTPNGTGVRTRGICGNGFQDVGANADGVVWATGGTVDANGDYAVYRYVGSATSEATDCSLWSLDTSSPHGRARYIDVTPGTLGSPWVVTNSGGIFHLNGVSATSNGTSWSHFGNGFQDVGVGPDPSGTYGTVWFTMNAANGNVIRIMNVQDAGTDGSPPAAAVNQNLSTDGAGVSITVGKDSLPWVVTSAGAILRRRP